MDGITKKSLRSLLKSKKRGKLKVLYLYYKDVYFAGHKLPAHYVAELISNDLKITIEPHSIYNIQRKYEKQIPDHSLPGEDNQVQASSEKSSPSLHENWKKENKKWTFSEPRSYGDELRKQFAKDLKNPPQHE